MAALGPFERRPRLAVAVSGGPDSMALALLAAEWTGRLGGTALGLTVDHGLRPESGAEARQVAAWLAGRGIGCRVLAWEDPKPATGLQAAAREARYRLLEAACREAGILHLLVAHHADDLAETAAIRAESGSGARGLAGMATVRERPGLRLLRPLLGVERARLAATLRAAGQPWLTDPSNAAPRFRRARLRAEPAAFDRDAWLATAARAAAERAAADRAVAGFAARAITPHPLGYLDVTLGPLRELPPTLAEQVLARAVQTVSGRPYPPASARLVTLARALAGGPLRATLAGVRLITRGERLLVVREAARIRDRGELEPGAVRHWDGRFEVRYRAGPGPLALAPLLEAGRLLLPELVRDGLRRRRVPAAAVAALPGLWAGERLLASALHAVAAPGGVRLAVELAPRALSPLAGAPFAGVIVV